MMSKKELAQKKWDMYLETAAERPLTEEEVEEMLQMHRIYNAPFWDKDINTEANQATLH